MAKTMGISMSHSTPEQATHDASLAWTDDKAVMSCRYMT
jgi:hypothetical protein